MSIDERAHEEIIIKYFNENHPNKVESFTSRVDGIDNTDINRTYIHIFNSTWANENYFFDGLVIYSPDESMIGLYVFGNQDSLFFNSNTVQEVIPVLQRR